MNTKNYMRQAAHWNVRISQHHSMLCEICFCSSALALQLRLFSFYNNKWFSIFSTRSIKFHCERYLCFWNNIHFLKYPWLHTHSVTTQIFHNKVRERLLTLKTGIQVDCGEPAHPVIQVQLLRIIHKWLFFFNLEYVKSELFPNFIPTVMDSFLVICCALCNFWQKNDVFEIECLMYFVDYDCELCCSDLSACCNFICYYGYLGSSVPGSLKW